MTENQLAVCVEAIRKAWYDNAYAQAGMRPGAGMPVQDKEETRRALRRAFLHFFSEWDLNGFPLLELPEIFRERQRHPAADFASADRYIEALDRWARDYIEPDENTHPDWRK